MIYKLTSIKEVIAKVFTDLDLQEEPHRITDMISWGAEALEKIGAFPSFTNKVTGLEGNPLLVIEDYICKLPYDFHSLLQVAYSTSTTGPFIPIRVNTSNFDNHGDSEDITSTSTTAPESDIVTMAMTLYDLDYEDAVTYLNSNPDKRTIIANTIAQSYDSKSISGIKQYTPLYTTDDITYVISNGYVKMNVETGYLMLSYLAIPVDSDGYPMIPDEISFKEALYWYINMKLMYPKWCAGQVRDAVYYDAKRSWNYYCKQAYGDAMMPDIDKLESIKNSWVRLVPNIYEHDSGFSTLGQEEYYYRHN